MEEAHPLAWHLVSLIQQRILASSKFKNKEAHQSGK
jgi:hypothetical protein